MVQSDTNHLNLPDLRLSHN